MEGEHPIALNEEDEEENGMITPFTETTVNLPEMPISPEGEDEERPTFDYYNSDR